MIYHPRFIHSRGKITHVQNSRRFALSHDGLFWRNLSGTQPILDWAMNRERKMTNGQAYFNGWKKGLDFSGVASRQEFWSFLLINLLILALPLATWFLAMQHNSPLLAVGCRRMHDIGRSGWWFALCLIIPWFLIVALWLCCLKPAASSR